MPYGAQAPPRRLDGAAGQNTGELAACFSGDDGEAELDAEFLRQAKQAR